MPHARKSINQLQRVKDNSLNVSSYVDGFSSNWEKCNVLSQRSTKITTDDEYSNFDFQVCCFDFIDKICCIIRMFLFSRNG